MHYEHFITYKLELTDFELKFYFLFILNVSLIIYLF